jgi:hypothetical protein
MLWHPAGPGGGGPGMVRVHVWPVQHVNCWQRVGYDSTG